MKSLYPGLVVGRWTVVIQAASRRGQSYWRCRCSCGNEKEVAGASLRHGQSASCGCIQKEVTAQRVRRHGRSHSAEYGIWRAIKSRCYNPNTINHSRYGGKGVAVCDRWLDSFENFFADMGPRPSSRHSIERKDGTKGYCQDNCVWATYKQQARNTSSNHLVSWNGQTRTLAEWSETTGIAYSILSYRINKKGWPPELAFTKRPRESPTKREAVRS